MTIEASTNIAAYALLIIAITYIVATVAKIRIDIRTADAHEKFNDLSSRNTKLEEEYDDLVERVQVIMENLSEARATDSFADLFRRVDRAFERACPPDGAYDRITDHIRSEEGSCAWPRYGSVASIREPRT